MARRSPGPFAAPAASFTRPADTTAYASGDLVANSTTAGSVVPMTFTGAAPHPGSPVKVLSATIHKTAASTTNAAFRLHLFTAAPAVANGDNGAFTPAVATGYVGYIDVTVGLGATAGSTGTGVAAGNGIPTISASSTRDLYGFLTSTAAYTPASAEVFTVTLGVEAIQAEA